MADDDKKITEFGLESNFPADFFDDEKFGECEPEAAALAKLDALDACDRFDRLCSGETASVKPVLNLHRAVLVSR